MKKLFSIVLAVCMIMGTVSLPASAMTQQEMLDRVRQTVGSPTPAPTATPAPVEEPAAEELGAENAPAPAEETGEEDAADEETADAPARAGAAAAFTKGYIEVRAGVKAYRSASSKAQAAGVFAEKGYAFSLRVNDAWLETAFVNAANKAVTVVYVRAADVTTLSDQAAAALLMTLGKAPKYEGYLLPTVKLGTEAATEEPTAAPTVEPTAEPTTEPTEGPTAEPTPEPTPEPTAVPAEEPVDEPTGEPTVPAAETAGAAEDEDDAEGAGTEDSADGEEGADEAPGEALSAETGEDEAEEYTAEPGEEQPEEGAEAGEESEAEAEGEEVVINASGTCGNNLTWTLSGSTLTISGMGKMYDYSSSSSAPWYSYRSSIKTIDIKNGVTSIGHSAFVYCSSLTSVTIPSSVTSIGDGAFCECSSLTSVTIPSSVTSIGHSAFIYCSSLTSVTIPSSVTSIGSWAFSECYNLKSVYAESLQAWLNIVIYGDEYWDNGNPCWNGASLYFNGKLVTDITIPGNVTKIPSNAFTGCKSLTYVTIPNSVTSIGNSAFGDCDSLTSVTIPNSVTSIGWYAFRSCSSLTSVTIPSSVTSIEGCAFDECSSLTDVYYGGTVEQWNAISIEDMEALQNATLHIVLAIANRASATAGDNVTIKASLSNSSGPLSYRWQFSNDQIKWSDTILPGYNTDTLTFEATEIRIKGRYYRCAITDSQGTKYTNCVTITWIPYTAIISADRDTAVHGETVTMTAAISGTPSGAVSYHWQTRTDGTDWKDMTNENVWNGRLTDTLRFLALESRIAGRYFRCAVSVAEGTMYSNVLSLVWRPVAVTASADRESAAPDDPVTLIAEVSGAPSGTVSYQWQMSANGTSWSSTILPGNETNTLRFSATEIRVSGKYYRCAVTDSQGTWYSNAVTISWIPKVTASADRAIVHKGDSVTFSTNVSGTQGNVSYQWQYSNTPDDEASWIATGLDGAETAALTFEATQVMVSDCAYRCAVTDDSGTWYTNAVTVGWSSIELSAAANRQIAKVDDPVTIRAAVTGASGSVTYRWQYSTNQTSWYNTSLTGYDTAVLSFAAMKIRVDGRYYRCTVTDSTGTWYTNAVLLEWSDVVVTASADRVIVHNGDSVTYTANVSGTQGNVAYQWQFSNTPDVETSWKATGLAGAKTAVLTFDAIQLRVSGRAYRCAVTDDTGTWYTNAVMVGWSSIELSAAANRQIAKVDDPVTIRAAMTGASGTVTYRWQYSANQTSWYNTTLTGYDTAVLSFAAMKIRIDGRYYRCAVTDSTGTWYTNEVLLGWSDAVVTASADKTEARQGDPLTYTVKVSGMMGEVSYQWQYSDTPETDAGWWPTGLTGNKTNTLTFTATETRIAGRGYRCAVTDDNGTWVSNPVNVVWIYDTASGTCGTDVNWTLDNNGTLTIRGTGNMAVYNSSSDVPWYPLRSKIKKAVVQNGVTSIGSFAFSSCTSLTSVTIPSSVTSIGSCAFYKCTSLTSVTIPSSVTSIGSDAFRECTSLTSVTIPNSVTSIERTTFYECTSLTSVTIPSSVTSIADWAFSHCSSLTSVTIPSSMTSIGSYAFCDCSSLTSVTIPSSVTSIGEAAFSYCGNLANIAVESGNKAYLSENDILYNRKKTTLLCYPAGRSGVFTIPAGITKIETYAFAGSAGLTGVTIPSSVTSIGSWAFYGCSKLTQVYYAGSASEWGRIDIGSNNGRLTGANITFSASAAAGVTVTANAARVRDGEPVILRAFATGMSGTVRYQWQFSDDGAAWASTGLTGNKTDTLSFDASKTRIDGRQYRCEVKDANGTWYSDPVSLKWLAESVEDFGTCGDNVSWELDTAGTLTISGTDDMASYSSSANAPWYPLRSRIKKAVVQNGVTSIGSSAFRVCTSLTSVTIPSSVTSIGSSAFYDCDSLTSVTIPSSVTSIGSSAFDDCDSLTSVTIPSSVTSIGSEAFSYCTSLTSVTIPSSVTSIGSEAFSYCTSLTSVTIPSSVTSIWSSTFRSCRSLTSIDVAASNITYSSQDGVLFNKDKTLLICCPGGKTGSYTIPSTVTSIGDWAFEYCTSLTSVTIPSSVTSIGSDAFRSCSSLTGVTIPSSVTSIGSEAFSYCTSLTSVTIPSSVTSIWSSAFRHCRSLTSIDVADSNAAYSSQNGVLFNKDKTLLICCPGGKTGSYTIPSSVTSIGSYAFYDCDNLTSVTIPSSVTSIGDRAFYGCYRLTDVYYSGSEADWSDIQIGSYNSYLTSSTIHCIDASASPESAENGETVCFAVDVSGGGTISYQWQYSDDGEKWNNTTLPGCHTASMTFEATQARLQGRQYRCAVTVNSHTWHSRALQITWQPVNEIGSGSCGSSVSWVLYDNGKLFIRGTGSMNSYSSSSSVPWYSYRSQVEHVIAENGVTSIGSYAFYYCGNLQTVTLPDTVTNVGSDAFYGCYSLTDLYINGLPSVWSNMTVGSYNSALTGAARHFTQASANLTAARPGDTVVLTVAASSMTGTLTYQWQVSSDGTSWSNTTLNGSTAETLSFAATEALVSGKTYRCQLRDKNGVWYSNTLSVSWVVPTVTATASATSAALGDIVTLQATAVNTTGSVSYQWQVSSNGTSWSNTTLDGNDTDILTFDATETRISGKQYRCRVTDNGGTWYTNIIKIEWLGVIVASGACGDNAEWLLDENGKLFIRGTGAMYNNPSVPWRDNPDVITAIVIENGITNIGDSAFRSCSSLTSVSIPSSVTRIGSSAFESCSSLTSVTIPSSVTSIGGDAFSDCSSLKSIDVAASNTTYSSQNGVLFNNDKTLLIYCPGGKAGSYTIPSSVTSIGGGAFSDCSSLTSVTIPSSVTSIGYKAFYSCTSLTSVTIPSSVTSIGEWAFCGCSSLTSVTIPSSVTSIGEYVFYDCSSLTSVTIPSTVTSIGCGAFRSCSSLTSVTIPSSVTSIGSYVFYDCSSLMSVSIPSSVTSIGERAFKYCSSLTSVAIPSSVISIENYAFESCISLTSIEVAANNPAYSSQNGVLFNKNMTTLICYPGGKAGSYTIPSSVTSIGSDAFYSCDSLTSVTVPGSVTNIIGFQSCSSLTSVTIHDGVTSIGDYAFNRCSSLTSVTIPSSVTRIGYCAFDDCSKLKHVYYSGTQAQWNNISIGTWNYALTSATIHFQR